MKQNQYWHTMLIINSIGSFTATGYCLSRTESKIISTRHRIHEDDEEVVEGAAAQLSHQLANLFRQKASPKDQVRLYSRNNTRLT